MSDRTTVNTTVSVSVTSDEPREEIVELVAGELAPKGYTVERLLGVEDRDGQRVYTVTIRPLTAVERYLRYPPPPVPYVPYIPPIGPYPFSPVWCEPVITCNLPEEEREGTRSFPCHGGHGRCGCSS